MTEAQLTEHFPGLSVMDFKVLCNIATRSRVSVDNVNNALARLRKTPYLQDDQGDDG